MGGWMPIGIKRSIIKEHAAHPELLQRELAAWVKVVFKLRRTPAQTTISDILKNAEAIMSEAYGDDKSRRSVQVTSPRLVRRLWAWIQEMERCNVCVSRELIRLKARDLRVKLCDAWDLMFSDGWLTVFEKRHGLRLRKLYGEAASADPETVRLGRERLQQVVELYDPQDDYNMDETGLCYATAPARSICTKGNSGSKKKKTRITLALTANADGSDALPPLYLGRAKQPRCFEKRTAAELGFLYRNNKKAWMTSVIFQEWLLDLDRDMRAAGRHILLLLDNASSHKVGELVCTNVQVEFLPPNTTAHLQPMDAGIIAAFKQGYRRKQTLSVFERLKDFDLTPHEQNMKSLGDKPYEVSQLQAMDWSRDVWSELQAKRTIRHCFEHTGIVFRGGKEDGKSCSYMYASAGVEDVFMQIHF